jgi:hypothetical protein
MAKRTILAETGERVRWQAGKVIQGIFKGLQSFEYEGEPIRVMILQAPDGSSFRISETGKMRQAGTFDELLKLKNPNVIITCRGLIESRKGNPMFDLVVEIEE